MLWIFKDVAFGLEELFFLAEVLKELFDQLVFLLDIVNLILLVLVQGVEFGVEVFFELEHHPLQQLDLINFAAVRGKLVWLIYQVENIGLSKSFLDILKRSQLKLDFPVHFFHASDFTGDVLFVALVGCIVVIVSPPRLSSQFALGNFEYRLLFANSIWIGRSVHAHLHLLLFGLLLDFLVCKLLSRFLDAFVVDEVRLASDTVHEVLFFEL